mgnify:CR=1 FL=1|jgi:methyltransferase
MSIAQWIVLAVVAQRLAELALARRNTARLIAEGAHETGAEHYPLFIVMHALWLFVIFALSPVGVVVSWPLVGLFVALQAARVWIIVNLGRFWTTRIITLPGAPLVRRGPYRWMKHPNYAVVVAELYILPTAFGLWEIGLVFTVLNLPLMIWRIKAENVALAERSR